MKNKHSLLSLSLAIILLITAGCTSSTSKTETVTLTVSAAASLTDAFTEISALFEEAHPQVEVILNFAGSQQLTQQILEGASVDVFASANKKQMDLVLANLELPQDEASIFAGNRLIVVYPKDNPAQIYSLSDLARPGLKLVLAGTEVPAGQYSLNFLDLAEQSGDFEPGYMDAVLANVVSYENNVRSVLTKVTLGEADGGIVYSTDAAAVQGEVGLLAIPAELNVIADYFILTLPDADHPGEAQAFHDFILSAEGQQVLEKYGFLPVQ